GKTTLFQLMTSAKETGRAAHGKGDVSIGISKVPDARLDRLTAMYNPRKRVPATVEFTDLAMPAGTGGAAALVDVVAYKNADALVHVVRALEEGRPLRALDLKGDDLKRLRGFQFLSAKPLLIVVNLDESHLAGGIDRAIDRTGLTPFLSRASTAAVAVCAKIELEIAQLDAADAAAFLKDLGLAESGLDRVIRAAYDLLG